MPCNSKISLKMEKYCIWVLLAKLSVELILRAGILRMIICNFFRCIGGSAPSAKDLSCRQGKVGQNDKNYFCYSSASLGYDMPHPSGPIHRIRGVRFFRIQFSQFGVCKECYLRAIVISWFRLTPFGAFPWYKLTLVRLITVICWLVFIIPDNGCLPCSYPVQGLTGGRSPEGNPWGVGKGKPFSVISKDERLFLIACIL